MRMRLTEKEQKQKDRGGRAMQHLDRTLVSCGDAVDIFFVLAVRGMSLSLFGPPFLPLFSCSLSFLVVTVLLSLFTLLLRNLASLPFSLVLQAKPLHMQGPFDRFNTHRACNMQTKIKGPMALNGSSQGELGLHKLNAVGFYTCFLLESAFTTTNTYHSRAKPELCLSACCYSCHVSYL